MLIQAIEGARSIIYQLSAYLQDSKLFFDHQYGFRPKHSIEYASIITQMDQVIYYIYIYIYQSINDFAQASTMFNFIIYATTLPSTLNTFSDNIHSDNLESLINDKLLKINEWLKINTLSLNIAQSKYMTFQKANKNIQMLTMKIYNITIE